MFCLSVDFYRVKNLCQMQVNYRRRPGTKNHNNSLFKNDKIRINNSAFVYIVFAVNLLLISDDKTQSKLSTDRIVKYGVVL